MKNKKEGGGEGSSKKKKRQVWVATGFEIGERGVRVGVSKIEKVGLLVDKVSGVVSVRKMKPYWFEKKKRGLFIYLF